MSEAKLPETPLPPVPGGLRDWSDAAKVYYLNLRARGTGLDKSFALAKQAFPDEIKPRKRPGHMPKWEHREAADYLAALRARLHADYSQLRFSKKWERVATVGNLALTLLEHFEMEDKKGPEASHVALTKMSGEIRQCMSEIHSHLEGAGLDNAVILSLAEKIEESRRKLMASSDRASMLEAN